MPPKQKKPPANAYYFFMVERRRELERQGYRFPGGMKDVAGAVNQEWKNLSPTEKARFEELAKQAKEADKTNLNNKFTVTGESYAQVMEKEARLKEEQRAMDEMLDCLTEDTEELDARNFVVMRTINICEVLRQNRDPMHLPVELTMASFSLGDGMKKNYWTLIDPVTTPSGYASMVKDTVSDTALPPPGSQKFRPEHKDYQRILRNVRKFIETYVQPYKGNYPVFVMPEDLKAVQGSLDWLVENAWNDDNVDAEQRTETVKFLAKIKLCKLTVLLLRLARVAKARDPSYKQLIAVYNNLEEAAARVLNEGCYDYKEDITCSYHNQEEESCKMHICCRNMVLRRIYLIIKEIVPHMDIQLKEGHDIKVFGDRGRPGPYISGAPPPVVEEEPEVQPKVEISQGGLASLWGSSSRNAEPKVEQTVNSNDSFQAGQTGSLKWGMAAAPPTNIRISDQADFPTLGNSDAQERPAPNFGWGRSRGPAAAAPLGRGAGRAVSLPIESSYEEDFPGVMSQGIGIGRGRGRGGPPNQRY